jgi:hypothetical protein
MAQINLGNRQLGVDEDWHQVGTAGEPSFSSGWVSSGIDQSVAFYKDIEGRVHIRGTMLQSNAGGQPSGTQVFQLPPFYRPGHIEDPQVVQNARVHGSANTPFMWLGTFEIGTDGWCIMANGWDYSFVRLDDVEFWAAGV